jgi:hypothetical protein
MPTGHRIPAPSDETLRRMYVDEGMSAQAIGQTLRAAPKSVLRWLHAAGIEIRGAKPKCVDPRPRDFGRYASVFDFAQGRRV